jgi:membrane-associated phospholipid phosphatase
MDSILQAGIAFIVWLQGLGAWLTAPMKFFSFLGTEQFYLLVAPAVIWCWDASLGLKIGLFLMISGGINSVLKLLFVGPRPYWYDPAVRGMWNETSYGIPSGHAQNAVIVWGALAQRLRTKLVWGISIVIIFIIGFSRIYLGAHFPQDVLVGWLVGALLLWVFSRFSHPITAWLKDRNLGTQILVAFVASLLIILLGVLARAFASGFFLPPEWVTNAAAAFPDEPIAPLALSGLISNAAAFFGLATGAFWLARRGGFNTRGLWWQLLLRFLIGVLGVLIVWYGLDKLFPDGESFIPYVFRFIRYALVGFWATGYAPFVFKKLKLAS